MTRADGAVEAVPIGGTLDLVGVRRAHRGDGVSGVEAGLEEAESIEELETVDGEVLPAQPQPRHPGLVEDPLIREVVNRQDRRHSAQRARVNRREAALPVVRMQDVEGLRLPRREVNGSRREERVANRVVGIINAGFVVDAGAVVQFGTIEQQDPGAWADLVRQQACLEAVSGHFKSDGGRDRSFGCATIARGDHRDVVPEPPQRLGQGRDDVGQPAGLGEGLRL